MQNKAIIKIYDSPVLMNGAVADFIVHLAAESVAQRERFIISLSGGNTPGQLYTLLSSPLYRDKIDWQKVFIFWGDERCVPENDERNNARMAKTLLLDKIDIPADNVYPIPVALPPAEAAAAYEKTMRIFFDQDPPRFDLILLGLGDNGHTASLFPGTPVIREHTAWVKEVYVAEQKEYRITMTAPLLNQARNIAFLVTGKEKANVLRTVLSGPPEPDKYPAQLIKPDHGNLYWFADRDAAVDIA